MTKVKKGISVIAACAAAVAIGAVSIGAADSDAKTSNEPEAPVDTSLTVSTVMPSRGDIITQGEFIGTIDPDRTVTIYPKAAGEVIAVNFDVGDMVQAGDVLMELDSKALRTAIAQTKASLDSAQAKANYSLAMAKKDLATAEYNTKYGFEVGVQSAEGGVAGAETAVENAKSAIESAELGVENAENARSQTTMALNVARRNLRNLRDGNDDTYAMQGLNYDQAEDRYRDAVRQAELARDAAELGVQSAKDNLERAKDGLETAKDALKRAKEGLLTTEILSEEQRISAVDRVKMAELSADLSDQYMNVTKMQDDLNDYTVKATIAGIIEKRNVDPYDMASQQTPVFVIVNKDAMTVSFNVSESSLEYMKVGDSVNLDKNGKTFTGVITEVASSVDERSGLFTVEATVMNPPTELYSGSTVKVFADTKKALNSILIPIDAIYYEGGKPYVYIAENGTAKKTYIETGITNDDNIQILSGVAAGDAIITTWNSGLSDGASIKIGVGEE